MGITSWNIKSRRGEHPSSFTYEGKPVQCINNTAWQRARRAVRLQCVRVHDLKHTFGQRLRAAGVPLETRESC